MTEQKKKTVAIVHLQHGVERFVFDSRQFHHESWHYALENVAVAIVPTTAFVRFEEWKAPMKVTDFIPNKSSSTIGDYMLSNAGGSGHTEIYSGVPNEHNMEKESIDANPIRFWVNPDGSYSSDEYLFPGDELTAVTLNGDYDTICVKGRDKVFQTKTYWYNFGRKINTNLTWYITKRLHQQA